MTTINEKEKEMLRAIFAHPMSSLMLSGYEKEVESLRAKINKKRIDKKAIIAPFQLKHFTFEMVKGNSAVLVTSSTPPNARRNYTCAVSYEEKEAYLAFIRYLFEINQFYGNPLASYQQPYGDDFNVYGKDGVERTYSINAHGMYFDSTPIYEEVGLWTKMSPSALGEVFAMLVPRLFQSYPEDVLSFGEEMMALYALWQTIDASAEQKVMLSA